MIGFELMAWEILILSHQRMVDGGQWLVGGRWTEAEHGQVVARGGQMNEMC
jgi:hypothetical protein